MWDSLPLECQGGHGRVTHSLDFLQVQQRTTTAYVLTALWVCGTALPVLLFVALLRNWRAIFTTYRSRLLAMRRGEYFFDRFAYREEHANRYVGFQVAAMTFSAVTFVLFYFY